jgi:hypothetical protein
MMDDEDNITVTAMLTYTHSSDGDPRHTPGDVVGRVVLDVTIETNKGGRFGLLSSVTVSFYTYIAK